MLTPFSLVIHKEHRLIHRKQRNTMAPSAVPVEQSPTAFVPGSLKNKHNEGFATAASTTAAKNSLGKDIEALLGNWTLFPLLPSVRARSRVP